MESKSAHQVEVTTPRSAPTDWNPDSEASQVTGGYSIGFSLTVLQVTKSQVVENLMLGCKFGKLEKGKSMYEQVSILTSISLMCQRVNVNNSFVRFCEQLPKPHLRMLQYKQLDLQTRALPRKRGKFL